MGDRRSTVLELTRSLIETPSENPPGQEAQVADVFMDRLESSPISFDTDRYDVRDGRPNVVATAGSSREEEPHVLLTGHMDVVPANATDWTGDPYTLRREDGRLIGRGTADMKAALAAKVVAVESFLERHPDDCRITLGFVSDEEWDGLGTQALIERGIDADMAIIGEPTELHVCVAQKGVTRYRIHVRGRSAHSGMPDRGENPVPGARAVLTQIESLDADRRATTNHPQLEPETVTVTGIEGGIAPNIVPDAVSVTVDWRTHPRSSSKPGSLDERIDELVSAVEADHPNLTFEWEQLVHAQGASVDAGHDVVRQLVAAGNDVGLEPEVVGFNAATDARFLIRNASVPTVLFGPGSIADDAHTVDESIDETDLLSTVETYECFLERVANGD
jgi:succinyl-diaminopimelate desuccinylase